MGTDDWREANRANWNERVAIHLRAYDLAGLRAGQGRLTPIEEAEIGSVAGKRVLHLQCHIGDGTLTLAQRGADVTGLDFSGDAIAAARNLASELGVRARFVQSDLYDAATAIPEPRAFDLVFVSWGALPWLPDIAGWARVAASFVKPGGALYLAEGHPAALVFDDEVPGMPGLPGYYAPYFHPGPLIIEEVRDYADPTARLHNARTFQYMHPVGDVVTALIREGLTLEFLHEHQAVAWRMFAGLVRGDDNLYRWPDKSWLPLAYSLRATRNG